MVAILISGFVSLSLTPMLCSRFLKPPGEEKHGRFYRATERGFDEYLGFLQGAAMYLPKNDPTVVNAAGASIPQIACPAQSPTRAGSARRELFRRSGAA